MSSVKEKEAPTPLEIAEMERKYSKHAMSVVFNNFEQALRAAGAFGKYHWAFILLYQLAIMVWCGNYVFMAYATYAPDVFCITAKHQVHVLNHSAPADFCARYKAGNCTELKWRAPFMTIIEQWNLICDLDYVPQMINSIQVSGTFVALFFTGPLSDMFGRKLVFCVTFTMLMISTFCSMLAINWLYFAVFRFFVGGLLSSNTATVTVWAMEMTDQKHNVIMNLAGLWQLAYMVTALIAYLTYYWKRYLLVLNLIGAPLLFIYPFCVESPRWLVQKGQLDKAARSLSRLGSNQALQREISSDNLAGIPTQRNLKLGYMNLFSTRALTSYTLVLSLAVFATAAAANAYIFQVTQMSGSPFLKFLLYGSIRMIIPVLIYVCDRYVVWFGRRHMMLIPMGLVFLCYLVATVLKFFPVDNNDRFEFYLMLAGAVICNALWVAVSQFTVELYPTTMRNTAFSFTAFFDPIAGVLMPQLVYLEQYWPALLVFVAALLSIVSFLASFCVLPETKGEDIPDTVEEMQEPKKPGEKINDRWSKMKACCDGEQTELLDDMDEDEF